MIRFWAGDLSRWVIEPCSCGRTYPRFPQGIYGRADDMFIVRGENVYPSAIENVLRGIAGFSDEFRIIITREKTMDEMIVQAEPLPDVPSEQIAVLQEELAARLKAKGLRTIVKMMDPGSLERTEFKAKRIIDERNLYDKITDRS
jgi:phenylacetate-CoA ligase